MSDCLSERLSKRLCEDLVRRLAGFVLLLFVIAAPAVSRADNVPGSAVLALPEMSERATGMIVRSVGEALPALRGEGAVQLQSGPEDLGATLGLGRLPLALSLQSRRIDSDRLEGNLSIATALAGAELDGRVLLFGGLVGEEMGLRSRYNAGRIDGRAFGLLFGLDYALGPRSNLTALLGWMALDYEFTRGGGAISGSFDASRRFVDVSVSHLARAGSADLRLEAGLRYLEQRHDAHVESGGAAVAASDYSSLSGRIGLRSLWGVEGGWRPYVDADLRFRLDSSLGLPVALQPFAFEEDGNAGRLAIGFERRRGASGFNLSLGANAVEGRFDGLDAGLNYWIRF